LKERVSLMDLTIHQNGAKCHLKAVGQDENLNDFPLIYNFHISMMSSESSRKPNHGGPKRVVQKKQPDEPKHHDSPKKPAHKAAEGERAEKPAGKYRKKN
jgi:hypothetical protein